MSQPAALLEKALGHHRAGARGKAEALYLEVLSLEPRHDEANHNLGVIFAERGELDRALPLFKTALEGDSGQERYWISYIDTLYRSGAHAEAAAVLELGRARGLSGARADALTDRLAKTPSAAQMQALIDLYAQGRLDKTLEAAEAIVQSCPEHGFAWTMAGAALRDLRRPHEAVPYQQMSVALSPTDPGAWLNLGNTYDDLGRSADAVPLYRRAIKLGADYASTHINLGLILSNLHRYVEAEASYRRAIALDPASAIAHQGLATVLGYLSQFDEVPGLSEQALRLAKPPEDGGVWEMRLYSFSYHPDLPAEAIYREFVRWGDRFPDPASDFSAQDRTPGRRLRVGYVSPDFRRHTSRFFFMPLMAHHDHGAFETFAYSNVLVEDEHTQAFKGVFDQWRNLRGVPAADAARMIREDGIDILVDCCNHMRDDRLDVFALKPAPIQVTWLGAAWTTGLKTVDYVLFDPHLAPEGTLAREEIVRLPDCFIAYRPPAVTAEVGPLPALARGYVTFGYSGRTERLNHKTFRVWGELLDRIPGARLILDYPPFAAPPTQAHYRELMARHGLDPARVEMRRSENIFLGLNDIDILLDCFPHSGGTMLFDALWMGVPALTLKSRPPLGRIGATLMTNLGMTDWIAETEADYVAKAAAFSSDLEALSATRAGLRRRMQASPLMDEPGFAKAVEAAYQTMWARWTGP